MKILASHFDYLRPLARGCELAGNDNDCRKLLTAATPEVRQAFVTAYEMIVSRNDKAALDEYLGGEVSEDRSEIWRLILVLDFMARNSQVPAHLAKTRFIEWNTRSSDDEGNEW
jgi:hypothetical protein